MWKKPKQNKVHIACIYIYSLLKNIYLFIFISLSLCQNWLHFKFNRYIWNPVCVCCFSGWIVCCWTKTLFAGVFIVAAKRTPFGTYGGVLKDHSATDLAEHAAKAALAAGGVAPELVNSVIMGNVMQVQQIQDTPAMLCCFIVVKYVVIHIFV